MLHLFKNFFESGLLVSGMSKVWEDTNFCAKQYRCDYAIYLMTVLSSSYGIIMDREISAPGHGNNVVNGINTTGKHYWKEQMELLGKISSNNKSYIGMLPSPSNKYPLNFQNNVYKISIIKYVKWPQS